MSQVYDQLSIGDYGDGDWNYHSIVNHSNSDGSIEVELDPGYPEFTFFVSIELQRSNLSGIFETVATRQMASTPRNVTFPGVAQTSRMMRVIWIVHDSEVGNQSFTTSIFVHN